MIENGVYTDFDLIMTYTHSVYEKFQAPVNLFYGSHFSATEATYEVFKNIEFFVESLNLQEVDVIRQYYFM